ncbi:MAG: DUF962 domain-containing protein [Chitinophagales bacterium]|nr:DUF962 domain-containing protein [Chitinophagales bacterium]
MKTFNEWLSAYGVSHQNPTNKLIHWICVPTIMFSLLGLLYSIPFPVEKTMFFNWAGVFIFLTLLFYLRLSFSIFLGFIFIAGAMLWGNHQLALTGTNLPIVSVILFVVAWIGQFIGHKIEGKKPSFFEDLQFLLIGPAWLLHFIYKKAGIPY